MLFLYRFLINIIIIFSPLIIIFRLIKKKEHLTRFKEKLCFFSKKRGSGKLVWFHGSSVGEILSIIPVIENLEKDKSINKILLTCKIKKFFWCRKKKITVFVNFSDPP